MPTTDTLLANVHRCMLAYRVSEGPAITPVACWSDGGGLWLTTSRQAGKVAALRRDPRCALWIAPPSTSGSAAVAHGDATSGGAAVGHGNGAGVVVDGTARIFDRSDPVGLALHAPTIAAALAGLALTHGSAVAGYVRDLPRLPSAWLPQSRVLIRVRIDRARSRMAPREVTGVGPVLPTELPSAVRRALTGIRHVTLATQRGDALAVQPAVWGAGFQLDVGATVVPEADTPACVAVDHDPGDRPSSQIGLLLRGTMDSEFRFHPVRASWWQGFSGGSAMLRAPATTSGIVLPD